MAQIMEMVQALVAKFFGGSAVPLIKQVIAQILEVVTGLFGRLSPA